jgi:hypothetical protein
MYSVDDNDKNERTFVRGARASWGFASRGARRHVERARDWVRAEGLEDEMRAREAHQARAQQEREARARARSPKRAHAARRAPVRASTDLEIKARAFGARTLRSVGALAVPGALIAIPAWSAVHGDPLALLTWPSVYGYLVWDGWMHRPESDAPPVEGEPATTAPTPVPVLATKAPTGLRPTAEEVAIIQRVATWRDRAAERRLLDVIPEAPVIDESGLLIPVGFGGQWTPAKLDAQADQVRALLAVPDEVRTQIRPGGTADRALIRVRTRVRDLDLTWSPDRQCFALDAETGEPFVVDVTDRLLVAGMSGAGKSVALRVLMAAALALPYTSIAIIDLKVEGALWSHVARVESEAEGIEQLVRELTAEMREREAIMRAQSLDMWEPTADRPRIVVAIDEGAELIAEVDDCMDGLRSLARRARSAGIVLWWATQKPTITGPGRGLDSAISAQLTTLISLAVSTPNEARNVFGEDAGSKGFHAEDLQKGGWAFVRTPGTDRALNPVRVLFMTKEDVKALPRREAWRRAATIARTPDILTTALRLSEGLHGVATATLSNALGIADSEVHAKMRAYGITPEPNAFAIGNGEKARGYRRSVLEAARNGRKE